jgi:hypothetical protein
MSVINDPVGTEGTHQFNIVCTANASYVRAKCLRDLHGKSADASRRAVNQDRLPRLKVPFIAKSLQGSEACDGHSRGKFEADAFGFPDELVFGSARVFGKGAFAEAEHGVAWLELRCLFSDCYDLASDVDAGAWALETPVQRVDGSGANADDNFVVLWNGLFEVLYFEDLSQGALGVDGGFHAAEIVVLNLPDTK